MDLILSLAEDLLLDFVWSDELLGEWERVIVREGQRSPEAAASVGSAVREFFESGRIDPACYRDRIDAVPGRDPDDRVHTAACAFGDVTVLLTRNTRDFPVDFLAQHGVMVLTADSFLSSLLRRRPSAFVDVVNEMARRRTRPPVSPCDLVAAFDGAGAKTLAAGLGRRLGCPQQ